MLSRLTARLAGLAVGLFAVAGPAKAEEISVTHWGALMYGAPYAVAMEKGLFKPVLSG